MYGIHFVVKHIAELETLLILDYIFFWEYIFIYILLIYTFFFQEQNIIHTMNYS